MKKKYKILARHKWVSGEETEPMKTLLVSKKQLCTSWEHSFFTAEADSRDWEFAKSDDFPWIETVKDFIENNPGDHVPDGVAFVVDCRGINDVIEFFATEAEAIERIWSELDVYSDWQTEDITPDGAVKELTDTENPNVRRLLDDYTEDVASDLYRAIEACEDAEDAKNCVDWSYVSEPSFRGYCDFIIEHRRRGSRLAVLAEYAREATEL
jgi:hypothetical protein